jgi:hypothetical protein
MSNKSDRFHIDGIDDLSDVDRLIRPLCDQAHRMFGLEGSPSFNDEGVWTARVRLALKARPAFPTLNGSLL